MIASRPFGLIVMLVLLFIGNIYGFITISSSADTFLSQYSKMNPTSLLLLRIIQVLNMIAIIGMWYLQQWGVWMALVLVGLVIILDIYYGIYYHIIVVLITSGLTAWFIIKSWNSFK
ncbi:hypothetical protein F9K33_10615 [bacterium]|nr:MAG: hypothetical protein F9K33_10615 [bacterium]